MRWFIVLFCFAVAFVACPGDEVPILNNGELGRGGGIFRADNGVSLRIPPEVLSGPTTFQVEEVKIAGPDGLSPVAPIIKLTPDKVEFPSGLFAFLNIPFDRSKVPSGRNVRDLVFYQRVGEKWEKRTGSISDGESLVTMMIRGTGTFGVFMGPPTPRSEGTIELPATPEPIKETVAEKVNKEVAPEVMAEKVAEVAKENSAAEPVVETPETTPSEQVSTEVVDAGTQPESTTETATTESTTTEATTTDATTTD